jgi:Arylsulfotransferase (ASST)
MDRVFAALFVLGLSVLAYTYGVASAKFELFPYELVNRGWVAAKALYESGSDAGVPGLLTFEATGKEFPTPRPDDADADLILMTGGAGTLMEHCPRLGCLAWLMDRQGTIHHAWPIDPDQPWGDTERVSGDTQAESFYPTSLHMYDNGDLLVSYHGRNTYPYGVGLAKFDKNGALLWKNENFSHHKLHVGPDGRIYTPAHKIIDSSVLKLADTNQQLPCEDGRYYDDVVYLLDHDGVVIDEISILQSLFASGYAGLVRLTEDPCDPIHLNDVQTLSARDAAEYPRLSQGDLLVSLRNISTLAVIDPATRRVKWLVSGVTIRQHSPHYIGNDQIMIFDNFGGPAGKGGSRLVKVDLASGASTTVFPRADSPDLDFFTGLSGQLDLDSERSRALVALTMQGRIVELDLESGQVLWEYKNTHEIEKYLEGKEEAPEERYATFGVSAAYYAASPSFLQADLADR